MKHKIILTALMLFLGFGIAQAQSDCYTEDASIWLDTWASCTATTNPKAAYGASHWIQYDLGATRDLSKTWVWNSNDPSKLNQGFNLVKIDYSNDGTNWTYFGETNFPQAQGTAVYGGFAGPDLVGIQARYILVTAVSNHGHPTCSGIAEIKFNLLPDSPTRPENNLIIDDFVCIEPQEIIVETVTDNSALISWDGQGMYYALEYWNDDLEIFGFAESDIATEVELTDLPSGTYFEFSLFTECGNGEYESEILNFTTLGEGSGGTGGEEEDECPEFEYLDVTNILEHIVTVEWEVEDGEDHYIYEITWGVKDEPTINTDSTSDTKFEITVADASLDYEAFISFECDEEVMVSPRLSFNLEDGVTALEDMRPEQQLIKIYPNPTKGQIAFDYYSEIADGINYAISNLQGQVIMRNVAQIKAGKNQFTVDLSPLPDGMYILDALTLGTRTRTSRKITKVSQ